MKALYGRIIIRKVLSLIHNFLREIPHALPALIPNTNKIKETEKKKKKKKKKGQHDNNDNVYMSQ